MPIEREVSFANKQSRSLRALRKIVEAGTSGVSS
jgi:hypothetical protein